jgi:hypothetical protein
MITRRASCSNHHASCSNDQNRMSAQVVLLMNAGGMCMVTTQAGSVVNCVVQVRAGDARHASGVLASCAQAVS